MRILFLTDSLSLPRSSGGEEVKYEDTYLAKLRQEFSDDLIVDSAIGGATILDLYKQVFYYRFFEPDIVILHVGIVDCAPRAWKKNEQKLVNLLRLRSKGLTSFMRKYRKYRYTSPSKFNYWGEKIKRDFKDIPVFALGILPARDAYESKVPGITKSITLYNSILSEKFDFIDLKDIPMDGILSDHHHLNKMGHQFVSDRLMKTIEKCKIKNPA